MPGGTFRKLRRRFGISAPRMSIQTHVAWYLRWSLGIALLVVLVLLALWIYDAGRRFAGFDQDAIRQELGETKSQLGTAREELERLRAVANAADSRLSIERTAQQKLAQQLQTTEQENARLREELATFESMLSSDASKTQGLSIYRFKVEPEVLPGEYRYRLLLLTSRLRREREFNGRLELVVKVTEDGRNVMMTFPEVGQTSASAFKLAFKYFQRVEGTFRVAPKARVDSVQVRVYEGSAADAKVTQTVTL